MIVPPGVLCMQDVLGHSNARVFVSHCGLHSVYEAGYHGVPVVGVPFMFEQVCVSATSAECLYQLAHRRHQVPPQQQLQCWWGHSAPVWCAFM